MATGYLDNGPTATLAWTQVGGGAGVDLGGALAVAGSRLLVAGSTTPAATYGQLALPAPAGVAVPFLGALGLTSNLASAAPGTPAAVPTLAPNPASGPAALRGAAPATTGQVLDALGRRVVSFTTDAAGIATLPAGLAPGLYLVRIGAATVRWQVER